MDDEQFMRILYGEHIADVFMSIVSFESMIINAMTMCDAIKVKEAFGSDSKAWAWMTKRKSLEASTLGSLVKILEKHDFDADNIAYLRWVRDKRDYFIHRHFHQTPWPAELDEYGCSAMIRRLMALRIILDRASVRIWGIFKDAGLIEIDDLGPNGLLISNASLWGDDAPV